MRIFKFSGAICAAAVCASLISVRADDTPAQATARAALEQKMQVLDTQSNQPPVNQSTAPVAAPETPPAIVVTPSGASLDTNDVPTAEMIQHSMMPLQGENQPAKAVQTPMPAAAPAPAETIPAPAETAPAVAPVQTPAPVVTAPVETPVVPTPPPAEVQPAVTEPIAPETVPAAAEPAETTPASEPISTDNATQAKALQALQKKMSDLDKQQAETTTNAPTEVQPAAPAPAEAMTAPGETPVPMPAPAPTVPVAAATPAPKPAAPVSEKPANINYPGKELGLKPIEAPAPPISADKQARLQSLLAKYMADQITPDEYHTRRAAILAEP